MATYRLVKRPASSMVTMTFDSYNAAIGFCQASAILNPSKPYKKGLNWHVSFARMDIDRPKYEKVEHWEKPFKGYDEWRNVEGLEKISPYVPQSLLNLH